MIRRGVGRVTAAVVAACVVGLMSGCALLAPPTRTTPRSETTSQAVPIAQPLPNLLVAGQTIGTGELRVIEHEPISDPVAEHPLTGAVRIVVRPDRGIEVRIRPDDPAHASLTGIDLMMTGKRHDGLPENIQDEDRFRPDLGCEHHRVGWRTRHAPARRPRLIRRPDVPALDRGDSRRRRAGDRSRGDHVDASLAFPGLKAVDSGSATNARGRTVSDNGTLAYYIPSPYDTIYQVTRRFGLTETQLLWLNPELLANTPDPELKSGIGVNLDPGRR